VREAALRISDGSTDLVVLFSGSFEVNLQDLSYEESYEQINVHLNECEKNLSIYNDLVIHNFLNIEK
jgi:hypothetical protein